MQIVIDIPEKDYDDILNGETKASALNWSTFNAIREGTPLPKGHKQALEAAKIIKDYCNSFPLMSCKGCVFDRSTGCALKNPCDFPETWELNDKIDPKSETTDNPYQE